MKAIVILSFLAACSFLVDAVTSPTSGPSTASHHTGTESVGPTTGSEGPKTTVTGTGSTITSTSPVTTGTTAQNGSSTVMTSTNTPLTATSGPSQATGTGTSVASTTVTERDATTHGCKPPTGFDAASFVGGIILALGVIVILVVLVKCYGHHVRKGEMQYAQF